MNHLMNHSHDLSLYHWLINQGEGPARSSQAVSRTSSSGTGTQPAVAAAGDIQVLVRSLPLHLCALDGTTFVLPGASAAASMAR